MENLTTVKKRGEKSYAPEQEAPQYYDMIVFCHLRWDFVYQRPQHLISRMSHDMKILLIEEPIGFAAGEENTGNLRAVSKHLHILQPKVRDIEAIADVIPAFVSNRNIPVGWFYSAAFSPLLESLKFETVAYDCMDELSLFKGAPQYLIDQEKYLLSHADIVFTGGKSLFESKTKMHPNVYCFPSSVDEKHFAKAKEDIEIPADAVHLPSPVVGYFGVIDERLDLGLLRETAKKMPEVSFVMIGPLAKIGESDLPKASNIHYPGMKSYAQLPQYLKAFDIAMMPFALNDATKYISPTKTLEYMAAGKPVISTKITDVVRDYSDSVHLIDSADEFALAIETLLKSDCLNADYSEILAKTSWDATAENMKFLLKKFAK